MPLLAKSIQATSVHVWQDFSPFGRRRDQQVADALGDVELVATGSPYLVSPGRVSKSDGTPYKVFGSRPAAGQTATTNELRAGESA